jgi:hypothetical protein
MEVSQEGAMDTPANGGAQPVVPTHHIYTFALALMCIALVAGAILFLMIEAID